MSRSVTSSKAGKKNGNGCVGVGLCIFSSIFIIVGVGMAFQQALFWVWKKAPCQIESFEIADSRNNDSPFEPKVSYTYRWEGQSYRGTRLSTSDNDRAESYESLVKIEKETTRRGTCFVNTSKPEEAILRRTSGGIWGGLIFALVGSLFFAVGVSILRSRKKENRALSADASDDVAAQKSPIGLLFFGIFALAGMGVFIAFVLPGAKKYIAAKSWEPTQATVIWSTVRTHQSDDSTTYSPDIFYRYRFNDEEHRSNSYSLFGGSSSGNDNKQKIVRKHPRGHQFTCYVNPKKPWQAIAQRDLGWSALLALIPLPFLAIGFGGIWWTIFGKSKKEQTTAFSSSHSPRSKNATSPSESLQKASSPKGWGKFIGHFAFAVIWSGAVSIGLFSIYNGHAEGKPDWFLTIFLIPFALVGFVALLSLPYSFIAIFSPRFDFELRDKTLKPGLATKFRWRKTGGSGELTSLTLTLFGQEQATYRQGTDTSTATSLFYQKELFNTANLPEILSSECDLILPSDAVPTLDGKNNKIRWFIKMHAEVKARPDVRDEIAITLHPFDETDFR